MEAVTLQIREKSPVLGECALIFVTVGSHYQGFDRLVKKMDEIAGKIDEKVIMQIGNTKYKPVNAEYFEFAEYSKIQKLNSDARIIVSHAGVGSILTAFEQKTHLIIFPRLKRYNEVVDDHQLQIAKELAENPNVTVVNDVEGLEEALKIDFSFVEGSNGNRLVPSLKKYIFSIS
ncbi:PssE/Cps14G family polysaccharide biosynthesis glycosyltransferase [Methanosarcina acetivorans]|uniref:PssE/Cps14G family polysaccharide biosynthesis glycosyltransferase n=1 Tax=Methanosarcina acetivorans TaxID=2214 RepID=UPI001D055B4C|nr:PssE/Cps14G family polysaccharide biosynthesis glycosyltransferase [Methanosarcina acetivorans]